MFTLLESANFFRQVIYIAIKWGIFFVSKITTIFNDVGERKKGKTKGRKKDTLSFGKGRFYSCNLGASNNFFLLNFKFCKSR